MVCPEKMKSPQKVCLPLMVSPNPGKTPEAIIFVSEASLKSTGTYLSETQVLNFLSSLTVHNHLFLPLTEKGFSLALPLELDNIKMLLFITRLLSLIRPRGRAVNFPIYFGTNLLDLVFRENFQCLLVKLTGVKPWRVSSMSGIG